MTFRLTHCQNANEWRRHWGVGIIACLFVGIARTHGILIELRISRKQEDCESGANVAIEAQAA
jgi:hypothetical protein